MPHHVRVLRDPDELRAAHTLFRATIHQGPADDEGWARAVASYEPERTFGVDDHGALIGTAMSFATRLAVPGGEAVPTAAVTRVGVRADRTRRGVLTAMMRAQLTDAAERGDVLAALTASEATIYGRFGYGITTRARDVRVLRPHGGWRPEAPESGTVRLLDRSEIVPALTALHHRIALRHTGGIERPDWWWYGALERRLLANEPVLAAVHRGPDGDDGFAVACPEPGPDGAATTLRIEDLHAVGAEATAGLWRFLLDVDLVGAVTASLRPLDEPIELLLSDSRRCQVTGTRDEIWLRLVDVPAALAARSWGDAAPVLLRVHDAVLPANSGLYRIGDGKAERTSPLDGAGESDLSCDVSGLAMAYLGDRAPSELVATGWWTAADPAAVVRADALFATPGVPWCGTFF